MTGEESINLVLLPGLDGTGLLFNSFISELPHNIHPHVIAYPPDKVLSLSEYADFVADQMPSGNVIVLAESFSGLVALTLASRESDSIRGLIFCASFAAPPRPLLLQIARSIPASQLLMQSAPDFLLRKFCLGPSATNEHLNSLRQALAQVSRKVLAYRLSLIATQALFTQTFSVPCLYLLATEDRLVPPTAARWFTEHFESCRIEKTKGPHFILQAKPKECALLVADQVINAMMY